MTREDVKGILPEITDEQLNSLMKRHGDTVVKLNGDITTLKGELATNSKATCKFHTVRCGREEAIAKS